MTTPSEFERWPNEKEKALIILLTASILIAFLILVVDWKIKQDMLRIAKEFNDNAREASPVGIVVVDSASTGTDGDPVVDGTAGMEAPASLKDYAHGVGRKKPAATTTRGVGAFRGSGSGDMEVPAEAGPMEQGGD